MLRINDKTYRALQRARVVYHKIDHDVGCRSSATFALAAINTSSVFNGYFLFPVWPSGKALGWSAEGPRFESASGLLSLQKLLFVDTVS